MTDQDRGAYTPQTDAPLAFDARRARSAGGGPAPFTLVVSAIVLLLLVVALFLFYRSGVRGAGQGPQVVGAPVVQTKAPVSDAPPSSAPAPVYKSEVTPPSEMKGPTFAPGPETPAPRPAPSTPVAAAPLRAAQPVQAPPAPPPSKPVAVADNDEPSTRAAPPAPVARAAPTPAATAPKPVKPAPAAAAPAPGEPVVQIGAFSSESLADKGWSDTAAVLPGRMSGRTRKVEKAERDGKTFYRAFVGGFATHADAQAFCAALQGAGKSCIVR